MEKPAKSVSVEIFAQPDDFGEVRASDLHVYDRLRVITDGHHFIVPLILLGAAVIVLLAARLVAARGAGRLGRLFWLWLDAKETELRARGRKTGEG